MHCYNELQLDMHMLVTLVPEGPWCLFYATGYQVYWGLTHIYFCWYSNLISHIHKCRHIHKDTQHTKGPVDLHTHVNIYLHYLLCAHSSYLYYTEWIIHWYQKITFHDVFSFQQLFTCKGHLLYMLIWCYKTRICK